jgi:hypothetical protein
MRTALAVTLLGASLALVAPAAPAAPPLAGAQLRYWSFSNGNDLRDALAYWAGGPLHAQLEYWDFVRGEDQLRPEIGLHLRDRRRSVYTLQWRHERHAERFWLNPEIVLDRHQVLRLSASPIVGGDSVAWVLSAGTDYYWSSYNFLSWTVVRDPRADDLWIVPVRLRLAFEETNWIQYTVAPASRRSLGWAIEAKKGPMRAGIERNSRYDFARLDNTIVTIGFEVPLGPRP